MKTIQLDVPDELACDIESAVNSGAFPDAGEFMRCAVREFIARRGSRKTNAPRDDSCAEAYERRARLLEQAWRNGTQNHAGPAALTLPALVAAMRASSQCDQPSTSMYFAGADVDHPYFLQSDALGIGIAVLPEDAAKALTRKRHPHQVEVVFVLDGALRLHVEANAPVILQKGDHYVIGKNVCHWVTPIENQSGVFAFVKTNPAQQPRGVSC
jgi:Arc/MetJ-type ribon-helix-helix transcriptional regulator/quercetin dioxygenase-like cupin family protein